MIQFKQFRYHNWPNPPDYILLKKAVDHSVKINEVAGKIETENTVAVNAYVVGVIEEFLVKKIEQRVQGIQLPKFVLVRWKTAEKLLVSTVAFTPTIASSVSRSFPSSVVTRSIATTGAN